MVHDLDVIQAFLEASIVGKNVVLFNQALKAQTVYGHNQLFAREEGLVVSAKISKNRDEVEFLVSTSSLYWQLIHRLLVENQFIPLDNQLQRRFRSHRPCQIPKGYELKCTDPRGLWMAWWQSGAQGQARGLMASVLLRTRNTWYPLRNLTVGTDGFCVKTLGHEIEITKHDTVIWLHRAPSVAFAVDAKRTRRMPFSVGQMAHLGPNRHPQQSAMPLQRYALAAS